MRHITRVAPVSMLLVLLLALPAGLAWAGDLNGDGEVDPADLAILMQGWREFQAGAPDWDRRADVDGDGDVDLADVQQQLGDFLAGYTPQVRLADYVPANSGDERLWVDESRFFAETEAITGTTPIGTHTAYKNDTLDCFRDLRGTQYQALEDGHFLLLGGVEGESGKQYLYDPPLQFPETLVLGRKVTVEADITGDVTGHITVSLTLQAADESVDTPAGSFPGCIRMLQELDQTRDGDREQSSSVAWAAPGVGEVKRDWKPDTPGVDYEVLQYAKIGTHTYGARPSLALAGLVPAATGNIWIWGTDDEANCTRVSGTKSVGGHSTAVFSEVALPLGSQAEYWLLSGGSVVGFAGWRDEWHSGPNDFVLSPAFAWGDRLTMGQGVKGEGTISFGGTPYAYSASVCARAFDQTVTTPAGAFQHCVAVDWRLSYGPGSLGYAGNRFWLAPGVGPVKVEDLSASTAQDGEAWSAPLQFAKIGASSYGTRPQIDAADAMELAQGNAARLVREDGGAMVQTVEAQEMVGGVQAWPVTTLQINTEGTPSARIESSYSQVTPTEVRFVGHRPDVFEAQGVTRYVASQAAALPRTMLMGEVYESSWVTFRDERNNQAIGQVKETVAYAGRQSATVTAGSFPGCDLLDSMIQFDGGEPNDVERRFLDPSAGMVKYVHLDLTDEWAGQRHDYDAEWVRAGAQTWGNAPAFDFASCFPLQVGNKWKIGTPGSYTEIGQVGAPGSLGGYSNVFPVAWHDFGGSHPQQWTDHWADKAGSRYFVGITPDPDEYPHTALLVEPPRLPLSCPLGFAERRDSSIVDAVNGSKLGTMHHFMMPVAAGLSVNTPAGRFDNCFLLFTITTNVVPSMDVFGYWYDFEYRAPGIGMVDYWTINEQNPPGNWDHAGSLLGAFINGTWYGEHF